MSTISLQLSSAHSLVCCRQGQSHNSVVTRTVIDSVVSYTCVVDDFLEGDSEFGCGVLLRGRKSRPWDLILRAAEGSHSETCALRTLLGGPGGWLIGIIAVLVFPFYSWGN